MGDIESILRSRERLRVGIYTDAAAASDAVALQIKACIDNKAEQGRPCVLGLATGSTPMEVYSHLIRMHRDHGLSFKHVKTFNLDEYLGISPVALQSYRRFMQTHLFDHVDILPHNTHVPDGTVSPSDLSRHCEEYERLIRTGGIDLQLLGLGRLGHIGFNERGSARESRTRRVALDEATRVDAAADFFGEEHVPRYAISMGVATILEARRIILMAFGEGKAAAVAQTVEGPVTHQVPASFLQEHPNAAAIVDAGAAAGLTRQQSPWVLAPVAWDADSEVAAAIWLARKLGRALLRLTDGDYRANSLQGLLEGRGPVEAINERVHGALLRTLTSSPGTSPPAVRGTEARSKGRDADVTAAPPTNNGNAAVGGGERGDHGGGARALVMSPHPDDDVIAMGGTLTKLVAEGLDVHVAYQTSGCIAVWDHDARRFAAFAKALPGALGLSAAGLSPGLSRKLEGIAAALDSKEPCEVDTVDVQRVKALIREGEAVSAAKICGVLPDNTHFLDMPFYQTGTVEKKPLSDADVQLVVALLERLRPRQLFAAGDLSDPHGTHRTCLQAILRALHTVRTQAWFARCRVWLYRGAWQEWEPAEAGMVVPLSASELRRKVDAIQRHQSQKDRPLFPGADPREFWQRALARNQATAQLYNMLGLPEHEAMEAFVEYDAHRPSPLFQSEGSELSSL